MLSETAEFVYKTTNYYHPRSEQGIRWDDIELNIHWPCMTTPILSNKDSALPFWKNNNIIMEIKTISAGFLKIHFLKMVFGI